MLTYYEKKNISFDFQNDSKRTILIHEYGKGGFLNWINKFSDDKIGDKECIYV